MIPIMFDVLLDVRNTFESGILGNPVLLGIFILGVLFALLLVCRVPPLFAFLLLIPASYGLHQINMLGVTWFWGIIVMILGILLFRIIIEFMGKE